MNAMATFPGRRRTLAILLIVAALSATRPASALNNCDDSNFADLRGAASIQIANDDPTNMFRYRPRCATISEGTRVVFMGVPNFGMHPMFGGTVVGSVATIDPSSPIGPFTSGTVGEVTFVATGEYPYFCDFHFTSGMMGSIRVVPELFADGFD